MSRNKYDDAYIIGYHNGYHDVGYKNTYDVDKQPQLRIKMEMLEIMEKHGGNV